jgi:hypothetical protein
VSFLACDATLRPPDSGLLARRWTPVGAAPDAATMNHHYPLITIVLATLALAAPTAVARPIGTGDGIRTSSLAGTSSAPAQDLRSPDARDAARTGSLAASTSIPGQDLRSPDARDAAARRGTFSAPDVTVVKLPRPMTVASDGGIDWGDVGIGAGGVLGLALLALGGTFAAHRRQSARRMATTG